MHWRARRAGDGPSLLIGLGMVLAPLAVVVVVALLARLGG